MAPHRARIVLADQQVLFRQSLAQVLTSGGHTVVSQVGDSDALDRCMIENEPDIVMLDRYLPGVDGLAYTRMLNALQPQTQILILVAYEHEARALQSTAFLAGASGLVSTLTSVSFFFLFKVNSTLAASVLKVVFVSFCLRLSVFVFRFKFSELFFTVF